MVLLARQQHLVELVKLFQLRQFRLRNTAIDSSEVLAATMFSGLSTLLLVLKLVELP